MKNMSEVQHNPTIRQKGFCDVLNEMRRAEKIYGNEKELGTITGAIKKMLPEVQAMATQADALGMQTWIGTLAEEFLEAVVERDPDKRRQELIQVAAVALRWAEKIEETSENARKSRVKKD